MSESPADFLLSRLSLNHRVELLEDTGGELEEQVNPGEGGCLGWRRTGSEWMFTAGGGFL